MSGCLGCCERIQLFTKLKNVLLIGKLNVKKRLLGESFIGEIGKVKGESRQASTMSTVVSRRLQYPGPHLTSPSTLDLRKRKKIK